MTEQMVVDPLDLADEFGIQDPTERQEDRIRSEILNAQADLEDFLNRDSLFPVEVTRTGVWKHPSWPTEHFKAWPWATDEYDDDIAITAATANGDGTWDVTLKVGLDGPNTHGIVRFVKAHVREVLLDDPDFAALPRRITSVSAEGQSISYDKGSVAAGAAGASPNMYGLRRYRRHSAHRVSSHTYV